MRRPPLHGLEVFLAIARHGSLRAAAASLGIGAPAVSHQLKMLERELGVPLFARTTRSVELTDAGRALLAGAGPALEQLAAALETTRGIGGSVCGTLRLSLPWSAYRIAVAPVVGAFQEAHPDVRLELSFDEALVDIVQAGFHAGIRLGDRLAPGMVALRLTGPLASAYFAAPGYLDRHGRPSHPRDLLSHQCIRYRYSSSGRLAEWQFRDGAGTIAVDPPGKLTFNTFQSVIEAACDGHGIGWALREVVAEEIAAGRLECVLERYVVEHPPFFLYYPEQNRSLVLLRAFADFVRPGCRVQPRLTL